MVETGLHDAGGPDKEVQWMEITRKRSKGAVPVSAAAAKDTAKRSPAHKALLRTSASGRP